MLERHIRRAGIRLIETALSEKSAQIFNPTHPFTATVKAQQTRMLNQPPATPKVISVPPT